MSHALVWALSICSFYIGETVSAQSTTPAQDWNGVWLLESMTKRGIPREPVLATLTCYRNELVLMDRKRGIRDRLIYQVRFDSVTPNHFEFGYVEADYRGGYQIQGERVTLVLADAGSIRWNNSPRDKRPRWSFPR